MSTNFMRVWKATGYCRTEGVLVAQDRQTQVWLPIERPVAADVRVTADVSVAQWIGEDGQHQQWASQAQLLAQHAGLPENVKVHVAYRNASPRYAGMRLPRAAALATVLGVAKALEHPLSAAALDSAELAVGSATGLASGRATIAGLDKVTTLPIPRCLWLYARPVAMVEPNEEFGRPSAALGVDSPWEALQAAGAGRASAERQALVTAGSAMGLEVRGVAGGLGPDHAVALLLDFDLGQAEACRKAAGQLRSQLGPAWEVGMASGAVPVQREPCVDGVAADR